MSQPRFWLHVVRTAVSSHGLRTAPVPCGGMPRESLCLSHGKPIRLYFASPRVDRRRASLPARDSQDSNLLVFLVAAILDGTRQTGR